MVQHVHRRAALLLALSAAAFAVTAGAAAAATTTTSVALTGGALTYTTPLTATDFPTTALTGTPQTITANVNPYVVTDARGGSAGWNVKVSASQFTGTNSPTNTLPTGSMRMTVPPVPTTTTGNVAVPPTVSATLNPLDGSAAQLLASAAAVPLGGGGQWTFTPLTGALALVVPASATPDTYTSTITTTLSSGPS